MKKALLIYSGGMDSTTLLYWLLHEGYETTALNFHYGSNHNTNERHAAMEIAALVRVELLFQTLDFSLFSSALLAGAAAVPEGHYAEESMKQTVVPFRNGIMLAYAAGIAASRGCDCVALGVHAGDHTIYPDCRPEFLYAMGSAITTGLWEHVVLLSPFAALDKGGIAKIARDLDAPLHLAWTCYKGLEKHCGACGACTERKEAFASAGISDPTEYEV